MPQTDFRTAMRQLKAFARQDAMLLAAFWAAGFAATVYAPQSVLSSLLVLSTPLFAAWRCVRFRTGALDGAMSYRRALAYLLYLFFYAAVVYMLAQYLYLRFIDPNTFPQLVALSLTQMQGIYQGMGLSTAEFNTASSLIALLRPLEWAIVFFLQNLLLGAITAFPLALVCKKGNS